MKALGDWLASRDMTQADFAKSIGVSQPTVSDWLKGKVSPSVENLRSISRATGLSIDDLVGLNNEAA